jgi:hypothetical protein
MDTHTRAARWLESMLVVPDGTQGIYERYRINLRRINPWIRPDCCIESGRALYVAGQQHGNVGQMERGLALARFVCTMQAKDESFLHGSFPFYRFLPSAPDERDIGADFGIPDLPNYRWHNDNGKIAEYLLWFYRQTHEALYLHAAEQALAYLLQAQSEDGAFTRTARGENHNFRAADFVVWGAVALARGYAITGKDEYADGARLALRWLDAHMHSTGRMMTGWETTQFEPWRPPSSETALALHAFAQGYAVFPEDRMMARVHALANTLITWQHSSGGIRNCDAASRAAAKQNDPDMTDLVYTDSYALIALQESAAITGNVSYRAAAERLADFLRQTQCAGEDPVWDGAWRGSYHLELRCWYGSAAPENDLEEGGMNAVYTGWCVAPMLYGLCCLSADTPAILD